MSGTPNRAVHLHASSGGTGPTSPGTWTLPVSAPVPRNNVVTRAMEDGDGEEQQETSNQQSKSSSSSSAISPSNNPPSTVSLHLAPTSSAAAPAATSAPAADSSASSSSAHTSSRRHRSKHHGGPPPSSSTSTDESKDTRERHSTRTAAIAESKGEAPVAAHIHIHSEDDSASTPAVGLSTDAEAATLSDETAATGNVDATGAGGNADESSASEEEEETTASGPTAAEVYARPLLFYKRALADRRRQTPFTELGPAQLVLPDKSMALGFPPAKENPNLQRRRAREDLAPGETVVVFTPPTEEQASKTKLWACILFFLIPADLILICTIFFLNGATITSDSYHSGTTDFLTFLCALIALFLGLVGMKLKDTRLLTLFIVVYYVDAIINLVRVSSILQLSQFFMQIAVCYSMVHYKGTLVPVWWQADA